MIEVWEHVRTSVLEYIVCMHLQLLSTASCSEVTCGYMWVIWVCFGRQACSQKTSKLPVTFWWSGAHCWCSLFSHASYRYHHIYDHISITATYCSYTQINRVLKLPGWNHPATAQAVSCWTRPDSPQESLGPLGPDSDEICSQVLDLYSNQKTQRDVKKSSKEEFWKFCSRDDTLMTPILSRNNGDGVCGVIE